MEAKGLGAIKGQRRRKKPLFSAKFQTTLQKKPSIFRKVSNNFAEKISIFRKVSNNFGGGIAPLTLCLFKKGSALAKNLDKVLFA
jgi:hypothetical protein